MSGLAAARPPRTYRPGSNPRDVASRFDWRFLLPNAPTGSVRYIGLPTLAEARDLRDRGALHVVRGDGPDLHELRDTLGAAVRVDDPDDPAQWTPVDLLVVMPGEEGSAFLGRDDLAGLIDRGLNPDGVALLLGDRRSSVGPLRRLRDAPGSAGCRHATAWWTLFRGRSLRAALPLGDAAILRYFFRRVFYGSSRKGRLLARAGRVASALGVAHLLTPGRALVLERRPRPRSGAVPHYLHAMAGRHGMELSGARAAFFARGNYDSNKVAFFLFARGGERAGTADAPVAILKMTRSARFNGRLEREHAALRAVHEHGLAARGSYPTPLFSDVHDGCRVVAQSVVDAAPFRTRTAARIDCPYAADALEWITALGESSRSGTVDGNGALMERVQALLDTLTDVYGLEPREVESLSGRIRGLSTAPAVPSVFRHGDGGTWNVVVRPEGQVVFLDWEAAERQGPPLWDLFDFLRSRGVWIQRRRGRRDRVANSLEALTHPELASASRTRVAEYCSRVGVPSAAVEPLFWGLWMERALREAEWAGGRLDQAQYIGVIRGLLEKAGDGRPTCLPA